MAPKKPESVEIARLQLRSQINRNETIASVVNNLIRCATVGALGYFAVLISREFAGQTTVAVADFVLRMHLNEFAAAALGGSGIAYGVRQRKLRRDTVERLAKRITELEGRIDPQRTSSRLNPRGVTPPEDPIR